MTRYPAFELTTFAHHSLVSNQLERRLAGRYEGYTAHIIGSGPSAAMFDEHEITDCDVIIVLNGAVQTHGEQADIWVMIEEQVWTFDWSRHDFQGDVILAYGCAEKAPYDAHPQKWWAQNTIWTRRVEYATSDKDPANLDDGLWQYHGFGSVALQAIHLACGMGVGHINLWGCQFYFPDGLQHSYGDRPYDRGTGKTGQVAFKLVDGEPCSGSGGDYLSTPYFINSAQVIRKIERECELNLIVHGGSLLRPETL